MGMTRDRGANFLLLLILLTASGVPVLASISSLFGGAFILAGIAISSVFGYIMIAIFGLIIWKFLRWYVPRVHKEYLTAAAIRSTSLARQVPQYGTVKQRAR